MFYEWMKLHSITLYGYRFSKFWLEHFLIGKCAQFTKLLHVFFFLQQLAFIADVWM